MQKKHSKFIIIIIIKKYKFIQPKRENFLFFWEILILFGDDFSFFGKIFHFFWGNFSFFWERF
jgi:hypothetical protein